MSNAETSGYLLMAGGLIWVLVGIGGLMRRRRLGLQDARDDLGDLLANLPAVTHFPTARPFGRAVRHVEDTAKRSNIR